MASAGIVLYFDGCRESQRKIWYHSWLNNIKMTVPELELDNCIRQTSKSVLFNEDDNSVTQDCESLEFVD